MKKTLFICICLILFLYTDNFAQKYNQFWVFGEGLGLDFNSTPPRYTPVGIGTLEASASVCDRAGNVLFYCDGFKVLDRTNTIMPNGYGIRSHYSTTQGSVIAAMPSSDSLFYLFSITDETSNGYFRYSVIDMSLNDGYGDIIPTKKNLLIDSLRSEKMCIGGYCGTQWLITHHLDSPIFYAYNMHSPGSFSSPVISRVGTTAYRRFYAVGEMKFSPDFHQLYLANFPTTDSSYSRLEVYDFDALTGIVSNQQELDHSDTGYFYSFDFSPSGNKLYADAGDSCGLYQYDLSAGSTTAIRSSKTLLFRSWHVYGIRTGPDGMVYVIDLDNSRQNISRIRKPELNGTACDIEYNFLSPPFPDTTLGILFGNTFPTPLVPINNDEQHKTSYSICRGDTLTVAGEHGFDRYEWEDGDENRRKKFTESDTIILRAYSACGIRTDTVYVTVYEKDTLYRQTDTLVCTNGKIALEVDRSFEKYSWSHGASPLPVTEVSKSGTYTATALDPKTCKALYHTFRVVFSDNITPGSTDTFICNNQPIQLNASIQNARAKYMWTNGDTTSRIVVDTPGTKIVRISLDGCQISDTFNVIAKNIPMDLGKDTFSCSGQQIGLFPDTDADKYIWSTGDTGKVLVIKETGRYALSILKEGCWVNDEIEIVFDNCDNCISIPNAFSPNNDGLNDRFKVFVRCRLLSYELMIYNRWGEPVFTSNNQNDQWDGTFKGLLMDTNVFYYMLRIKTVQAPDKTLMFKGDINLLK